MMSAEEQNAELWHALQLIPDDLAANRAGRLSPRQIEMEKTRRANFQAQARKAAAWTPLVPLFYLLVLVAVAAAIYLSGAFRTLQAVLGSQMLPALGIVALLVVLYLAWIPVSYRRGLARANAAASKAAPPEALQVYSPAGPVKIKKEYNDDINYTWYYIVIEGNKIPVSEQRMKAFRNGNKYREYFTREGKTPHLVGGESQLDS